MASAYEAIIKIGVQGQQELDRALNKIERLNQAIGEASSGGRAIQSLQAYNTVLKETAAALRIVEIGTNAETAAVRQYVTALGQANAVRERQSKLIADQVRQQRLAASGIRETSNQYARPAGPAGNAADAAAGTFRAGTAKVTEATKIAEQAGDRLYTLELKRIEDAATAGIAADNEVFQKRIASEEAYWNRRLKLAAQARQVEARDATRAGLDTSGRGRRRELDRTGGLSFDERLAQIQERRARPRSLLDRFSPTGSRKNAIEGAAIGGGFPLLFGQGAGASVGGLLGGGLGGALTGSGAFAGGIVGSLIGTQFDKLKASALGLADALKAPSEALAAMEASGIKVSSGLKNTVDALEGLGRATEAQALVFAELEKLGGTSYVQNLLELEEVNKELQEQWSKLSVQVQNELLPAFITLTETFTALAKVLRESQIVDIITRVATVINGIPRVGAELLQGKGLGQALAIGGNQVASAFNQDQKTQRERQPGPVDDTRQRKALDEAIARQKEVLDLQRRGEDLDRANSEFARDQAEKILDLRKRAADYDREVIDFRRAQEDKLFAKQQENDRLRITAEKQIADNRVAALENAFRSASANDLTEGGPSAIVAAANEYIRIKATGEAEIRAREQETKLKILAAEREGANYSYELKQKERDLKEKAEKFARDVSTFQYETTNKIVDLQRQSVDYQYAKWEQIYKLQATLAGKVSVMPGNPLGAAGGAPENLQALATSAGFTGAQAGVMAAIAMAESGGRAGARNNNPRTGDDSYGLWQINMLGRMGPDRRRALGLSGNADLYNPATNARAAKMVYDQQGFNAWSVYRSGAYKQYLGRTSLTTGGGGGGNTGLYQGNTGRSRGDHFHVDRGYGGGYVSESESRRMFANSGSLTMTSGYGARGGTHKGVDLAGAMGTPLNLAPGYRLKSFEQSKGPTGNFAWVIGPNNELYRILHLADPPPGWKANTAAAGGMALPSAASVAGPNPRAPVAQGLGSIPQPSAPSLAGYGQRNNALDAENRDIQAEINALLDERQRLDEAGALTGVTAATNQAWMAIIQPLKDANREFGNQIAYNNEYADLIASGVNPAMAEQLTIVSQLASEQERLLDLEIQKISNSQLIYEGILKETDAESEKGKKIRETIDLLEQQKAVLEGRRPEIQQQAAIGRGLVEQKESPQQRYKNAVTEAQGELTKLTDPANQVISAANGIGDAFGQAFQDVATGSKTAQEALSDMFKNIGASFIQMAAQIAAEQLTLSLLKLVGGSLLGGVGGGGAVPGLFGNSDILNSGIGAGFGGAFASGGSPPVGKISLVGENGPELFIPSVSGTIIPNGPSSAVLDSFNGTDQSSSSNEPIRVETTTINSVEYATVGQVRQASAAAAKQGEARALNRLYSSTSARKRLGM